MPPSSVDSSLPSLSNKKIIVESVTTMATGTDGIPQKSPQKSRERETHHRQYGGTNGRNNNRHNKNHMRNHHHDAHSGVGSVTTNEFEDTFRWRTGLKPVANETSENSSLSSSTTGPPKSALEAIMKSVAK